jgi:predicted nucleic acid-binding protein
MTWPAGPWVVDTSAWARAAAPEVSTAWKRSANSGNLIICPVVTLELLYQAQDSDQVERTATACAALRQAPITRTVTDAATMAIRELASKGAAGSHRVRVPDALIAAAAAERGFGVLHYDHHFDRLAEVLAFESRWVAPAGTLA